MDIMILFNFLVATDDDLGEGLFPDINLVSRTSRQLYYIDLICLF